MMVLSWIEAEISKIQPFSIPIPSKPTTSADTSHAPVAAAGLGTSPVFEYSRDRPSLASNG